MKYELARVRGPPMLEQIDALPSAERELAVHDRNTQMRLRQRGSDMRGHVVGTFGGMFVYRRFRRDPLEIGFQVPANRRVGILLDEERRRGVPAKDGHQSGLAGVPGEEASDNAGELRKTAPGCLDGEFMLRLLHHA